jgi:hypothetical protein
LSGPVQINGRCLQVETFAPKTETVLYSAAHKGKPVVRRGRKASDLLASDSGVAGPEAAIEPRGTVRLNSWFRFALETS